MTRFINRNDAVFGSPFSTGLGADGKNGIGVLTVVESSAKARYNGMTLGMTRKYSNNWGFQANYTLSEDKSDDDNERDPFLFRYARADALDREYNYSDRDQRHRFNAFLLTGYKGFEFNTRVQARSAQPKSVGDVPADRIQPNGTIILRNTLRKDNEYLSLDLRVSKVFKLAGKSTIEGILDLFNLTNATNFKRPSVTNLVFNFDGTVQDGVGDPRQAQLGVRVRF